MISEDRMIKFFDGIVQVNANWGLKRTISIIMLALILDYGRHCDGKPLGFISKARSVIKVASNLWVRITPESITDNDTKEYLQLCHQFCYNHLNIPFFLVDIIFSRWYEFAHQPSLHSFIYTVVGGEGTTEYWKS